MPYIDPNEIERVKQIDLLTYLMSNNPDELIKKSAREYTTKTHDSLSISNGKWNWFSRGIGGKSALDYLIKVKDMSFLEAVRELMDANTVSLYPLPIATAATKPAIVRFMAPPRHKDNETAKSYLRLRGIDAFVIADCIKQGLIYENRKGSSVNAVFIGKDKEDKARYAHIRGCKGDFRGEAKGSDKRYSFRMRSDNNNPVLHVFESAIDALSYATLILAKDLDWRHENLLSLGGIQPPNKLSQDRNRIPQALAQWLADEPRTKVIALHLDNDEPGIAAADAIATALHGRCECLIIPPPEGNDMNDYLMKLTNPTPSELVELEPAYLAAKPPKRVLEKSR